MSGEVFFRPPGGSRAANGAGTSRVAAGFTPVKGAAVIPVGSAVIPVGSTVNAVRGRVALTSVAVATASGATQTTQQADFYEGTFRVRQARARRPVTDIALRRPTFGKVCGANSRAAGVGAAVTAAGATARRPSKRVVTHLFGNGQGRFRTIGRRSVATVRGTIFLTQERCDGTLTRVTRGVVSVCDLVAKRTVAVRAGGSYLARATRASVRTRKP